MTESEPSYVACPCGFRAQGSPKEALAGYRAHECPLHQRETDGSAWPGVVAWVAALVFVAFLCSLYAGLLG